MEGQKISCYALAATRPGHEEAHRVFALAIAAARRGQPDVAVELLKDDARALWELARVYEKGYWWVVKHDGWQHVCLDRAAALGFGPAIVTAEKVKRDCVVSGSAYSTLLATRNNAKWPELVAAAMQEGFPYAVMDIASRHLEYGSPWDEFRHPLREPKQSKLSHEQLEIAAAAGYPDAQFALGDNSRGGSVALIKTAALNGYGPAWFWLFQNTGSSRPDSEDIVDNARNLVHACQCDPEETEHIDHFMEAFNVVHFAWEQIDMIATDYLRLYQYGKLLHAYDWDGWTGHRNADRSRRMVKRAENYYLACRDRVRRSVIALIWVMRKRAYRDVAALVGQALWLHREYVDGWPQLVDTNMEEKMVFKE